LHLSFKQEFILTIVEAQNRLFTEAGMRFTKKKIGRFIIPFSFDKILMQKN